MTLILDIPPDLEARLRTEARRRGLDLYQYARQVIVDSLVPASSAGSLSELFSQWEGEDGTLGPAEIARRNREFEEFQRAMNRNWEESEGPSARKPFPVG